MKTDKKKENREREASRPSPFKALFVDLNDQLQSYLNALKTAGSDDARS